MDGMFMNNLPPGTYLNGDRYQIKSILGSGGFGITYKAYDHLLHSLVAIKEYFPAQIAMRTSEDLMVLPRSASNLADFDWGLQRFLDEARTLSKFEAEPNIVRVKDYIREHNTAYMIMKYEEGTPLDEYLHKKGTLSEQQLQAMIFPILDGLRAVHAENFLHRDIKPSNIYLRKSNGPILLDFGAARQALGEHAGVTLTGIITEGYAPIEQYSQEAALTEAADLYALGATMYHCITGQAPPAAVRRMVAIKQNQSDPLLAAEKLVSKQYSAKWLKCIAWLLQLDAAKRPKNVAELQNALLDSVSSSNQNTVEQQNASMDSASASNKNNANSNSKTIADPVSSEDNLFSSGINGIAKTFNLLIKLSKTLVTVTRKIFGISKKLKSALVTLSIAVLIVAAIVYQLTGPSSGPSMQPTDLLTTAINYKKGIGVKKDFSKDYQLYQQAANGGNITALVKLGVFHYVGIVVGQNKQKARQMWTKAAYAGNPEAQYFLGSIHMAGYLKQYLSEGSVGANNPDLRQAHHWFKQAAEAGEARALRSLGVVYEKGLGVDKDLVKAKQYYQQAYNQGNEKAQDDLLRLNTYSGVLQ